jgi:hypothetical protein
MVIPNGPGSNGSLRVNAMVLLFAAAWQLPVRCPCAKLVA